MSTYEYAHSTGTPCPPSHMRHAYLPGHFSQRIIQTSLFGKGTDATTRSACNAPPAGDLVSNRSCAIVYAESRV